MNFLIKLFVKDYKNINDEKVRCRYGTFSGILGIITNTFLVVLKLIIGIISASIALIADAVNNLSDAISSVLTIVGFKLSQKDPDEKHPFGHERIEYITSLFIAVIILIVGGSFLISSIKKCINPDEVSFSIIIIVLLGVSILVKFWQGLFYRHVAKIISSPALKAASRDSFSDCIVTTSVLISTIVVYAFNINIDAYTGILVSLFILYSGIKSVFESTSPLIGELPDKSLVQDMLFTLLNNEIIKGYHDLVFHIYGPSKLYASIHLEFDYKDDILEVHEFIDELEKQVYEKYKIELVVHMDPVILDDPEINNFKRIITKMIEEVYPDINMHDFRVVKGPNSKKILFDVELTDKYYKQKQGIKKDLQRRVEETLKGFECIIVIDTKISYT